MLKRGTRLGPYEVLGVVDTGGMGDVYRGLDTRLGRPVAIKVVSDPLSDDPARRMRLEREARIISQLNHPNICTLFDVGEHEGFTYLVMELLDGETLEQRLTRAALRGLPLEEALAVAIGVADGLDAAHRVSVVHRDVKPANVMLARSGVKLLDFGVAKAAVRHEYGCLATNDSTVTLPGALLGTVQYMSPEQVEGREADARSDIFSFGALLHEMVSGRRAFDGDNPSRIIAAVLEHEPPAIHEYTPSVPTALARIINKCLAKDPDRRWQSARDLADNLRWVAESDSRAPRPVPPRPVWRRALPFVASVLLAVAVASVVRWVSGPRIVPRIVARFMISLGDGRQFSVPANQLIGISPDGTRIVYSAEDGLYVRSMGDTNATLLPVTARLSAVSPVFSPDGRWIVFYSPGDRTIQKVATDGGAAVVLCAALRPFGISWDDSGILFGQADANSAARGILRVSPDGGPPELIVAARNDETISSPQMLADGEHVLYTLIKGDSQDRWDEAAIVVESLKSGQRRTVIDGGSDGRYLPTGEIVFSRGSVLHAFQFDTSRLKPTAGSVPLLEGVSRSGFNGVAAWSLSANGTLAYVSGLAPSTARRGLALMDRNGTVDLLKIPPGPYQGPRVSPDGKSVAVGLEVGKNADIWVYPLHGEAQGRRLTFAGRNRFPIWSWDGRRIAFQSDREGDRGIFWQSADGTGTAERLTTAHTNDAHVPESWEPNGEHLLFRVMKSSGRSLMSLRLEGRTTELLSEEGSFAKFSPDGRWVTYVGYEGGSAPVYIQSFPSGQKYQVWDNATQPVWWNNGQELMAMATRVVRFEAVNVMMRPAVTISAPTEVPFRGVGIGPLVQNYDLVPNERRLLILIHADGGRDNPQGRHVKPEIQVVLNWADQLAERVRPR